jgi:hypothetical protein
VSLRDKANELAEKARRYADGHKSKIDDGIERVETLVDKRTGGQYHDRIATAMGKAKDYIEKLPQTNLEREARSMTAEPSVNDLTPMLAAGVENEPMLLLDTTGSMSYPVAEDSKVGVLRVSADQPQCGLRAREQGRGKQTVLTPHAVGTTSQQRLTPPGRPAGARSVPRTPMSRGQQCSPTGGYQPPSLPDDPTNPITVIRGCGCSTPATVLITLKGQET